MVATVILKELMKTSQVGRDPGERALKTWSGDLEGKTEVTGGGETQVDFPSDKHSLVRPSHSQGNLKNCAILAHDNVREKGEHPVQI